MKKTNEERAEKWHDEYCDGELDVREYYERVGKAIDKLERKAERRGARKACQCCKPQPWEITESTEYDCWLTDGGFVCKPKPQPEPLPPAFDKDEVKGLIEKMQEYMLFSGQNLAFRDIRKHETCWNRVKECEKKLLAALHVED